MKSQEKSICGVFRLNANIANAKRQLRANGFLPDQFATKYSLTSDNSEVLMHQETMIKPLAWSGAMIGAATFTIIAIIILNIPQFESLNMFTTVAVGLLFGTAVGAGAGALVGIGTPRKIHNRYKNYLDAGGVLLTVATTSEQQSKLANAIFLNAGAIEISENKDF